MKKLKVLTSILGVVSFSGCTSWSEIKHGETKPQISYVKLEYGSGRDNSGKGKDKETDELKSKNDIKVDANNSAMIFAWSPKNNAAVINKDGKSCVQGADVFHAKEGSIDIGNDILNLVKGITPSGNNELIATKITNKINQLKTNTERNSYLSIGMFGLCQLYVNGQLSESDLKTLVNTLITASAQVGQKTDLVLESSNTAPSGEEKK
ncbi:hypothetical protein QE380_003077 [Acinetobacter baylyi]|uniref:Uncharacterized protein n=1 Tax=Acinetobacter baylyi TaxID=202950 RepID=A0ABU0V015_ACIBI|nr:hypothetical protein [Acinetobacter baylyi]MDQ1210154.1 hypothetical protein [Acinetobacter baylyi]MDR6106251.1 hypothetical protein [Acinetobacter baylyi]MDR6187023.1 hypothetical protein [Acinetobacter baylyi]